MESFVPGSVSLSRAHSADCFSLGLAATCEIMRLEASCHEGGSASLESVTAWMTAWSCTADLEI